MGRQKKIWKDHNGQTVPAKYVPKLDKERERVALKIFREASKLHNRLAVFKTAAFADADKLYEQMMDSHGVKSNGSKGNFIITTFNKDTKIEVNVSERIEFNELIDVAHEKIKKFLSKKTLNADKDLIELVNLAFRTNKGLLDAKRVISLFNLKINDALWKEAMDLIRDSMSRNVSKRYMRIWKRNSNGEYKAVELNFSSV